MDGTRRAQRAFRLLDLVEAYSKAQGMFRTDDSPDPEFDETLALVPAHRAAEQDPITSLRYE
mgnify:CR=1 FL=1